MAVRAEKMDPVLLQQRKSFSAFKSLKEKFRVALDQNIGIHQTLDIVRLLLQLQIAFQMSDDGMKPSGLDSVEFPEYAFRPRLKRHL